MKTKEPIFQPIPIFQPKPIFPPKHQKHYEYSTISEVQSNIEDIEKQIELQIILNKKMENHINTQIESHKDEMDAISTQSKMYLEKDKLTNLINCIQIEYDCNMLYLNDKIAQINVNLDQITTTIDQSLSINVANYIISPKSIIENEHMEKTRKSIQSQLLKKLARISNISENTIFNINLSKVLPLGLADDKKWADKLTPEQLSVLLRYIYSIVQIIIKYYQMVVRYQFETEFIFDPITDAKFKLFEKEYKQFKVNKTLDQTIQCLKYLIIDLLYWGNISITSEEEEKFHLLQLLNKLLN
jgi:hypothetical protein